MDKLIILGTGNAMSTNYYNTCFCIDDGNEYFLVDGGGGNGILRQMEMAGVDWNKVRNIFISHKHTDHAMGAIWCIRKVAHMISQNQYDSNLIIHGNTEVIDALQEIANIVLPPEIIGQIGSRILFTVVHKDETIVLGKNRVTYFDILSSSCHQFGFRLDAEQGYSLAFLGDETCRPEIHEYLSDVDWLLCNAYCTDQDSAKYAPWRYHHSTVKESCMLAKQVGAKNLILWHTEDDTYPHRKELYQIEGEKYYDGTLFLPEDLAIIDLH